VSRGSEGDSKHARVVRISYTLSRDTTHFSDHPLSYAAVPFSFGQYEKLLRYGKLANSYRYASETLECVFFVLHLLKVGSK